MPGLRNSGRVGRIHARVGIELAHFIRIGIGGPIFTITNRKDYFSDLAIITYESKRNLYL